MRKEYLQLIDRAITNLWWAHWFVFDHPAFEQHMHAAKQGIAFMSGCGESQMRAAAMVARGANVLAEDIPLPLQLEKVKALLIEVNYCFDPNNIQSNMLHHLCEN